MASNESMIVQTPNPRQSHDGQWPERWYCALYGHEWEEYESEGWALWCCERCGYGWTFNKQQEKCVRVEEETLKTLRSFANTHGDEYGHEKLYHAIHDAGKALALENPEPYMVNRWDDDDEK